MRVFDFLFDQQRSAMLAHWEAACLLWLVAEALAHPLESDVGTDLARGQTFGVNLVGNAVALTLLWTRSEYWPGSACWSCFDNPQPS